MWIHQRPWYLSSMTLMSWWKRSPCSSLTSPRFAGKDWSWLFKKCNLMLILQPSTWKLFVNSLTSCLQLFDFLFQRTFFTTETKAFHAFFSRSFMDIRKSQSFINLIISVLSNLPAFCFSIVYLGKHCTNTWNSHFAYWTLWRTVSWDLAWYQGEGRKYFLTLY